MTGDLPNDSTFCAGQFYTHVMRLTAPHHARERETHFHFHNRDHVDQVGKMNRKILDIQKIFML